MFAKIKSILESMLKPSILGAKFCAEKIYQKTPVLLALFLTFMAIQTATRIGLFIFNADWQLLMPQYFLSSSILGLLFDVSAFIYWAIGITICILIARAFNALISLKGSTKNQSNKFLKYATHAIAFAFITTWLFIALSEFTFWHEFNSRFNFIAVDYLIYTSEVLGNIQQSYNLPLLLAIVFGLSILFFVIYLKINSKINHIYINQISNNKIYINNNDDNNSENKLLKIFKNTGFYLLLILIIPIVNYLSIQAKWSNFSQHREANELALNGHFAFGHAFFANQIDYAQFYPLLPKATMQSILQKNLGGTDLNQAWLRPINTSNIPNQKAEENQQKLNVVLISIESMSADFLKSYGNQENITPFLDSIADKSLWFKQLYATGTRTVRGLEALSMSIPPTPGHSIVKRNNNENLATLGHVFKQNNYKPYFIYGGYGAFDNMNYYFKNSSYEIVDRTTLKPEQIHYENIWGVADEDLFTLTIQTLNQEYKENQANKTVADSKPFFAHVMTTSNHRPFTYPDGRIDIPSKTNRQGAVKYTDWAIADFFKRAEKTPWFKNTVFVIVADHCASARGKTDLPVDKFLIPLFIYAPAINLESHPQFKPQTFEKIASQIDIAPTLLGLLNIKTPAKFFGQNMFDANFKPRAFMANYQTVGMLENQQMVELRPQQQWRLLDVDMKTNTQKPVAEGILKNNQKPANNANVPEVVQTAIAYYQGASFAYQSGLLKDGTP